jgi:transposase-like protein
MKKGRLSKDEQRFISENSESLSVEQIASELDRDPKSIAKWIMDHIGVSQADKDELESLTGLRDKAYYRELKKQFTESELEMFEFHFKKMWSQFKDDVFHTEEIQIIDTIKLEILMNRILVSQAENQKAIEGTSMLIQVEKQKDKEDRDRDYIINLERQLAVLRGANETLSKDYKDLQTKKTANLKELKGTREQRIKSIEDSKQSFAAFVKKLVKDPEHRKHLGLEMEKMRLATERERDRLGEIFKYEDKGIDRPFLTADTVSGTPKERAEAEKEEKENNE